MAQEFGGGDEIALLMICLRADVLLSYLLFLALRAQIEQSFAYLTWERFSHKLEYPRTYSQNASLPGNYREACKLLRVSSTHHVGLFLHQNGTGLCGSIGFSDA